MSKMVKEFIEVRDHATLDALIENLTAVRDSLLNPAEAEVKMRGDDVFGRQISISFYRPQTDEEAAFDARYANAVREARERELARLQDEVGFCEMGTRRRGGLRIVA